MHTTSRTLIRRACTVLFAVPLLGGLLAGPALAHGRGSDATNFHSVVTDAPDLPGLTWRVYGGDEFLGVTNTSGVELVVLGYSDEPYLRIGPDGVFENRNSDAVYLNRDRLAQVEPPPDVDPEGEPEWVQVADQPSYLWHDHRIHWMSPLPPPQVQGEPDQEQVIFDAWEVPVLYGGEPATVVGELRWVPAPSPWPWVGLAVLLTLPGLAGLRSEPLEGEERWPGLIRPAAAVVGAVALLNVTHLVDDLFAVPLPLATKLLSAGQTALFLAIAAFGTVRAWQAREGAFTALGIASGALLVGQGLLYMSVLQASQTASVFPDALARLVVAASLAQVVPAGVAVVVGTRRLLPDETTPVPRDPATTPSAG